MITPYLSDPAKTRHLVNQNKVDIINALYSLFQNIDIFDMLEFLFLEKFLFKLRHATKVII